MRTWRNTFDGKILPQQILQLSDQFRLQHVFDCIRALVHSSRSHFRMSNKVKFPQAMFMDKS